MKTKLISLLLCLSLLACCLAGCGQTAEVKVTESPAPTETPAPADTPAPTDAPVATEEPAATEAPAETPDPEEEAMKARYRAAYEKYDPDQTVLLINDEPVTWSQYYSWIYDIASQMESAYAVDDWNAPRAELLNVIPDATFGSYVKSTALGYVTQIAVIGQKAREMGIELSEAQRSQIQATIDGYAANVGGQEQLEALLADSYITMDYFVEQNEAMTLINSIYENLYGKNGEKLPDEDAISYLKDSEYLYAKHILFRTVDDAREKLSDEEIEKKKAEAEDVLAQLQACTAEELPEKFDSLMKQFSEDTGLLSYPDGYYFRAGEMVPAFEETVRSLEENGLSGLVESDYGYHIIFCPPMSTDHIMGYGSNGSPYLTKEFASAALFDSVAGEWYTQAQMDAKYVGEFDALDLNELFGVQQDS